MAQRLIGLQGPDNVTTYFSYADTTYGQTVTTLDGRGNTTVQEYWAGELAKVTDPLNHTTYFVWPQFLGNAGQNLPYTGPIAVTDATGRTSYFQYDTLGHQLAATDALGHSSYYQYDGNNLTRALDPLGHATYYGYDAYGQRISQVDPLGAVRYWQYDDSGYVTAQVDPLGRASYFSYLNGGLTRAAQDPRGNLTYSYYDQYGFTTAVTDALGASTYYVYDDAGRVTQLTDARGGVVQRGYSTAGNLTVQVDQLSRTSYYSYDADNRPLSSTDPRGHRQYFHYDANGNQDWARDAAGGVTYSLYDAANRRTAVLDPLGQPTYYTYDAAGRQLGEIDAQGHEETATYDAVGRVSRRDQASGVGAYYSYDAAGRLTQELRYPSGDAIYYTYDARGAQTAAQKTGVPDEAWSYDAAGQVTANSQGDQHLYYAYDATGNRSRLTFQGGGVTYFTYYAYDARNQLAALTSPLGETVYYQYDALGREIARRLPNTVTTYHNYDAASQVTSLIHRGSSSVLQSLYYMYDADGQRTRIEREDNTRIYYSYDAAHRLTGEDWLDPSNTHLYAFAYNYDAAGNRTKQTCNSATTYYSYNNLNELTIESVLGGAATYYTWTADGEMATKHETAGWTYYTWDVDESLKTIQTPTVTLESKYNSRMQRVWRSENGTAEKLIYDAQKLIAEATSTGTALNRYYLSEGGSVYSPLLAQLGSEHWFLADALGTTLGLTNTTGTLTDTFKYEAFGTSLGRTGTTATPYQYVGGYGYFNEPSVGLEQVWWRWLTGANGRWLSRDKDTSSPTPYQYAANAPSMLIDLDGRNPTNEPCKFPRAEPSAPPKLPDHPAKKLIPFPTSPKDVPMFLIEKLAGAVCPVAGRLFLPIELLLAPTPLAGPEDDMPHHPCYQMKHPSRQFAPKANTDLWYNTCISCCIYLYQDQRGPAIDIQEMCIRRCFLNVGPYDPRWDHTIIK